MRRSLLCISSLLTLACAGCMLDPNSWVNVNRGNFADQDGVRREARSTSRLDHEDVDGLDRWLYSPKARAIQNDLGVD
ncbi:MAG: hypothetical protein HY290_18185 [Planctomycetia bacterium]|nr:hypothetical protein [Planctomycetia bacterium]